MTNTAANASAILTPDVVGPLLVQPVQTLSVAAQVSTVVSIHAHAFRVPVVATDPCAAWVATGEEITPSDMQLTESVAELCKIAGLSIISNELRDDTNPAAASVVGDGLARDIASKLDAAFFGALTPPAPAGLASLAGVTAVQAPAKIENTDVFAEAVMAAESVGAALTTFVANPADVLALAKVKKATGSNEPLLSVDPTLASRRMVSGVPVMSSPAVTPGTIWGIPQDRVYVAMHDTPEIEVDSSAFFTSDRTAVRAKLRAAFAFAHPAAMVKITMSKS